MANCGLPSAEPAQGWAENCSGVERPTGRALKEHRRHLSGAEFGGQGLIQAPWIGLAKAARRLAGSSPDWLGEPAHFAGASPACDEVAASRKPFQAPEPQCSRPGEASGRPLAPFHPRVEQPPSPWSSPPARRGRWKQAPTQQRVLVRFICWRRGWARTTLIRLVTIPRDHGGSRVRILHCCAPPPHGQPKRMGRNHGARGQNHPRC